MTQQTWDPNDYARHAGFVAELGHDLIELLAPRANEDILDLGCGDGALTVKLASCGCRVVAVDNSTDQVKAAVARGLDARVGDGEALHFTGAFDGVVSNAALHWMKRPEAVIEGVWRALRPGGRFVGELGGAGNIQTVVDAAMAVLAQRGIDGQGFNPWFFPDESSYATLLQARGFEIEFMQLFARTTPLDGDIVPWLKLFAQSFAAAVEPSEHDGLYREIATRLEDQLRDADGHWQVDYVRLRFKARRPVQGTDKGV